MRGPSGLLAPVLLFAQSRSGLLPQPGGFEGFGLLVGKIGLRPHHQQVIVERPDGPNLYIQVDAAPGAPRPGALAHKDLFPLNPEIKGFDPLLLEGVRLHPRPQRRRASQRRLTSRRDELNLGMGTLRRRIEVASIEGLIGAAQRVDHCRITLVHRPSSISLWTPNVGSALPLSRESE